MKIVSSFLKDTVFISIFRDAFTLCRNIAFIYNYFYCFVYLFVLVAIFDDLQ